jgi:ribulose-phosphate 3-epimerase
MNQVAICPTITAFGMHDYRAQMEVLESFAERIHIDLMDGIFAPHVSPGLEQVWWPPQITADLHLMFQKPAEHIEQIIKLHPNLVIIHLEAEVDHVKFAADLQAAGIRVGLALLQSTRLDQAVELIPHFDDVMVYSGHLGEHGGVADLSLLDKVRQLKLQHPLIEISWDGGINDQNAKQLVEAGVSVLNVGGFIASADSPQEAYAKLRAVIKA